MKPTIPVALLTLGILTGACTSTYAQNDKNFEKLSLEDLLNVKITTVSKTTQKAAEAPATVIVISAKQIKTRGYRNLAQVLNDLTDVKVDDKSDPATFNTFTIRGIARQDRFVILMDGVKISSPTNEAIPLLENFPIYLAKQVEVVFGPGSALYGADAMSGVINIITEKSTGNEQLHVTTMEGTQGYTNQHVYFQKTLPKGMNLTAAGQYNYDRQPDFSKVYADEFSMQSHETGVFNSIYGPMQANQPLSAKYSAPVKNYNMYVALNKGGFDFKFLRYYSQVPSSTSLQPSNGVFNKDVFYGHGLTTANISYADSIGKVRSVTSLQGSAYEINPKSNFRNVYGNMEHGYKFGYGSMVKFDEQLNFIITRNITSVAGFTVERFNSLPKSPELSAPIMKSVNTEGVLLNSADVYNPAGIEAKHYHLLYNNIGSFFQTQFTPGNSLAITAGIRYDHNSRFGATINPRLGVVYRYAPKTIIKAMFGTAYWAPSPHVSYEQYGSFYTLDSGRTYQADFLHLPNPGLKPTTSKTSEISLNQDIGKGLHVTVTAYYTRMHDLITGASDNGNTDLYNNRYLNFSVAYIEVPVNAGTQTNYGGNVNVNSVFNIGGSRINAWTSASFVDGYVNENISGKLTKVKIPYVAPWQFRAGVDGNSGDLSYSFTVLRSGKQRVTGFVDPAHPYERQTLAGYTLVNAAAGYTFKGHFNLFIKVENALNVRYRNTVDVDLTATNPVVFAGSLQDPIRVMAGVNFSL
jgi:outer membrane receptor for ferrienterochelin and colicin